MPLWMEMCEMLICGYLPPTKALGQSSAFELSYTLLYISSMDSGIIYQVQLNVNKHVSTVNKHIALEQHIYSRFNIVTDSTTFGCIGLY